MFDYILEKYSVDANKPDINYNYPILYAIRNKNKSLIDKLLNLGAKLNSYDYDGKTPFDSAEDEIRTYLEPIYEQQASIFNVFIIENTLEKIPVREDLRKSKKIEIVTRKLTTQRSILKKTLVKSNFS